MSEAKRALILKKVNERKAATAPSFGQQPATPAPVKAESSKATKIAKVKKAKAAKAVKVKTPKAPRVTVSSVMRDLILAGKDNKAVLVGTKAKFSDFDTEKKSWYPSWYRSDLRRKGLIPKHLLKVSAKKVAAKK